MRETIRDCIRTLNYFRNLSTVEIIIRQSGDISMAATPGCSNATSRPSKSSSGTVHAYFLELLAKGIPTDEDRFAGRKIRFAAGTNSKDECAVIGTVIKTAPVEEGLNPAALDFVPTCHTSFFSTLKHDKLNFTTDSSKTSVAGGYGRSRGRQGQGRSGDGRIG